MFSNTLTNSACAAGTSTTIRINASAGLIVILDCFMTKVQPYSISHCIDSRKSLRVKTKKAERTIRSALQTPATISAFCWTDYSFGCNFVAVTDALAAPESVAEPEPEPPAPLAFRRQERRP